MDAIMDETHLNLPSPGIKIDCTTNYTLVINRVLNLLI